MINEKFILLSEEERQTKFKSVLKQKTENALSDDELRSILVLITMKKQYRIFVYSDAEAFTNILDIKRPYIGRTIFGQALVSTVHSQGRLFCTDRAAAVLLWRQDTEDEQQLHIYIPANRNKKEAE